MKNDSNKHDNLKSILWSAGFHDFSIKGQKAIADYFNRDPRTIRRWIKANKAPQLALDKLEKRKTRLNEHWDGFTIDNDSIITPNGYSYTASQLKTLSVQIQALKALNKL